MSELSSREELPEEPLRLKDITITFICAEVARIKPEQIEELLSVMSKGSLNYLLELAAEFRELMRKEEKFKIDAIGFPVFKNPPSEEALRKARKNLSKRAKKLVDELLKIEKDKPLIITRKGVEPILPSIHSREREVLHIGYLNSFPYSRVEGSLAKEIPFGLILETGRRAGDLEDSDVAEFSRWVNPNTRVLIQPMLRLHGGYPAYTLAVAVIFPPELELGVHQVNKLTNKLNRVMRDVTLYNLFGKEFYNKIEEAFEEVLGFKPEFIYRVYVPIVFASLDFDKSFEELVKRYPLQIAAIASGMVMWPIYSRRDAEKDVKKCLVRLYTDHLILAAYGGVVLTKRAVLTKLGITPREPLARLIHPFNIFAILAQDFAITVRELIDVLSDSLRGGEFRPHVLVGLREYVTRLLSELGGYYRLATADPFRSIWRTTYRVLELHRAEGELKELLSAIDRRLKRAEERRFSFMSILLGTLGVFGALEFILGVFSLWGINTYTKIVAGAVALTITTLLSLVIHYMRR
ncbi:MAG: hypothetical protein LM569_04760 [Desulfurococcaceae archaeon]|nr:hypothetical protein [Desulfurococcaceae archaeon]